MNCVKVRDSQRKLSFLWRYVLKQKIPDYRSTPCTVYNTKVHNMVTFRVTWENRNVHRNGGKGKGKKKHQGSKMSGWWDIK